MSQSEIIITGLIISSIIATAINRGNPTQQKNSNIWEYTA